jgi:competence protein ComEA
VSESGPSGSSLPSWRDRIDLLTQSVTLSPRRAAGAAALLAVLAVGAWFALRSPAGPPTEELLPVAGAAATVGGARPTTPATTPSTVLAHAAGAVAHPGVYELPGGARVTDLIDAAGGPAEGADLDRLNLAAPLSDGERVYVPFVGEPVDAALASGGATADIAGPLDLNAATLEQLDALPGIGPTTAQAIIDERERRGGFRSVEELLDVRGIGPAKLERLRDLVTV